jgi:hypothetical protein
MIYGITLIAHISLAVFTGALILYILAAVSLSQAHAYRKLAEVLGMVAGAQVLTGTMLAVLSPTLSAAALSAHVFAYLSVCGVVEGFLLYKMRVHAFPVLNVAYSMCMCIFAFALVVVLGF